MTRKGFIVLLWLTAALPLLAQADSGTLSGTVRDAKTGKGISGAIVSIKMNAAGSLTVSTDAEGRYVFAGMPAGSGFKMKVTKSNYDEWKGTTPEVKGGGHVKKEISLNPAASSGSGVVGSTGGAADGTVTGKVTCGGQALAGVTVSVGKKSATTAADGSYSIKVPAGEYPIEAKKAGYKKFEAKITVAPGGSASRNIELKPKK